jgi:aminopeptidase-like protein
MKKLFDSCQMDDPQIGEEMYSWAQELFPVNRSITGEGNRKTLQFIQRIVPAIRICSVKSGTRCCDWTVPPEWNVEEAYLIDPSGERVIDFHKNNLHLLGYSEPIDKS